jgi:hypothetical protein
MRSFICKALCSGFATALFNPFHESVNDYRVPREAHSRHESDGWLRTAAVRSAGFGMARQAQRVVQDAATAQLHHHLMWYYKREMYIGNAAIRQSDVKLFTTIQFLKANQRNMWQIVRISSMNIYRRHRQQPTA